MTWQYRVMKKGKDDEQSFGVHEVFYDDEGRTIGWTKDAVEPHGDTLEELWDDMRHYLRAFALPVLDYHAKPEGKL